MDWVLILVLTAASGINGYQQFPMSPCLSFFSYIEDINGNIKGHVQIPPPMDFTEILVTVRMVARGNLPEDTESYGEIVVNEDINVLLTKLLRKEVSLISYTLTFPPYLDDLPILLELNVNNITMCSNSGDSIQGAHLYFNVSRVIFYPKTIVRGPPIRNTNYAGVEDPCAKCICRNQMSPTDHWQRPNAIVQTTPTMQTNPPRRQVDIHTAQAAIMEKFEDSCGIIASRTRNNNRKDSWPWQVAIYKANPRTFACGGTLVSDRHILTSGLCLLDFALRGTEDDGRNFEVHLGKYNLKASNEGNVQKIQVEKIMLHTSLTIRNRGQQGLIDVAIIVIGTPALFDDYVKPICLYGSNIRNYREHAVYGWGNSLTALTKVRMVLSNCVGAQSGAICAKSGADSTITLCKADRGGGLCSKESGGTKNKFYLRGVLSKASWKENNANSCIDNLSLAVFTSIDDFSAKKWILENIYFTL